MSVLQQSLSKIEGMLGTIVGGARATKKMGPPEFVSYAHGQITRAMGEPSGASTRRLKALYRSVQVFKDNYSDDSGGVNVPIYVNDVTAMDDKSTALTGILAAANLGGDEESAFEQGFVTKFVALRDQINELLKAVGAKADDDDPDAEEKRKKAADSEDDEEEGEEKRKAADDEDADDDAEKPTAADKKKATAKVRKGADVAADGTQWPADVNDPAFQKDGTVSKTLEWGADPS